MVRFPDAPTTRGTKHIKGLIEAKKEGYDAYILFVVQLEKFQSFEANGTTDPAFKQALEEAEQAGVHILVKGCHVTKDTLTII